MSKLKLREEDIRESFVRSSGPGGQNVNKVSTCVYLKHLPTGIEVKCQQERSQAANRILARRILSHKIEALLLRRQAEEKKRLAKMRRPRKRPLALKERILEAKRRHSLKKSFRAPVRYSEE